MPTALIAEDEPLLAAGLQAELARLWPELEIVAQAGDGDSAVELALARIDPDTLTPREALDALYRLKQLTTSAPAEPGLPAGLRPQ
jgi:DNA-binding NarL/FixJ family response regulator